MIERIKRKVSKTNKIDIRPPCYRTTATQPATANRRDHEFDTKCLVWLVPLEMNAVRRRHGHGLSAAGGEGKGTERARRERHEGLAGQRHASWVRGRVWLFHRSEEHTSELQSLRHLVCR